MSHKSFLALSFIIGAVLFPAAAWLLMIALSRAAGDEFSATVFSSPFIDSTMNSPALGGRAISVTGNWVWAIIALFGGAIFSLVAGCVRVVFTKVKR